MRCFIAIDIGEENEAGLGDLQSELDGRAKDAGVRKGDVKWVRAADIHLTLKFLGEVRDSAVVEICNIVSDVAGRCESFELDFESVGCFGGRSAKILWVGTGDGAENLVRLQKDIDRQLALADWPEERRAFAGHLTLCRVRNSRAGVKLVTIIEDYKDFKLGVTLVDSVTVYESQLTPKGPVYMALGNYKLAGNE